MKKLTLIVCALATTVASFATTPQATKAVEASKAREAKVVEQKLDKDFTFDIAKQRQATYDVVNPYITTNVETYYCGTSSKGINYIPEPCIISPATDKLAFSSYYSRIGSNNLVNTWLVNGVEQATGSKFSIELAGPTDETFSPLMKTAPVTVDTFTYSFVDYQYGALASSLITAAGYGDAYPYLMVAPWYLMPLTKMALYSEDPAISEDDPIARDFFWLGSGYPGDGYKYGTKLVDPFVSTDENIKYIDTIFVPYINEGTMYIDHITMGIVSEKSSGAEMFSGENDHVRLSIYPITEKGIDFSSPIARAKANADNFTGTGNYGLLQFNFTEVDPITQAEYEVPAIVNGPFVVALDEFNDGTANFAIFGNYYNPVDGDTYFVSNDSIFQLYDKASADGRTRYPSQIMLQLYALLPVITDAPATISFDNSGEKTITLTTNVWAEDMDIEAEEDWITVSAESVLDADEYLAYAVKLTVSVEASDEVRAGTIYINALGAEYEIKVGQNGALEAIENVNFKNDNKMYNVLGVEVGEDYKGIVIRNGEKFIR